MNEVRRYLTLREVTVGMTLAAPLLISERGLLRFSLPEGHVLNADNLHQLRLFHAEFVPVYVADQRTESEREQDLATAEARLNYIFRLADMQVPAIAGLYNAVLAYRKR